jgi:hypothetical protein
LRTSSTGAEKGDVLGLMMPWCSMSSLCFSISSLSSYR